MAGVPDDPFAVREAAEVLGRQDGGPAEPGAEQSEACRPSQGEGSAASSERGGGAEFRPLLRDGGRTAEVVAGKGGGDEAVPDDGGETGPDPVASVRRGKPWAMAAGS